MTDMRFKAFKGKFGFNTRLPHLEKGPQISHDTSQDAKYYIDNQITLVTDKNKKTDNTESPNSQ